MPGEYARGRKSLYSETDGLEPEELNRLYGVADDMNAQIVVPKPKLDLATMSEDDVVKLFGMSLEAFVTFYGGRFQSRRVTLRQENTYPSDQDFAVVLPELSRLSLHLFSLQFKRWDSTGWHISARQAEELREMGHVIAYALPRPEEAVPGTGLHFFDFVNPALLPTQADRLQLRNNTYNQEVVARKTATKDELWLVPHLSWGELFRAALTGAVTVKLVRGSPPRPSGGGGSPSGFGLRYDADGPWHGEQLRSGILEHLSFWGDNYLQGRAGIIAYESFSAALLFLDVTIG